MVLLNLAGFCFSVDPAVYGGEGNPQLLGEFFLRDSVFQAVGFELLYEVVHFLHLIAGLLP